MKTIVDNIDPSQADLPYSHAIIAEGPLIFLSGQVGRSRSTGQLGSDIVEQTTFALENMRQVLRGAGADLGDVVRVLVFLATVEDGVRFNEAYTRYFPDSLPVRTRVQAGGLAPGYLVEMEAIAVLPDRRGEGSGA